MKEFDYRKREPSVERALEERRGRTPRRSPAVAVAEALHRAGAELPVQLAQLRLHSPGKYRQALGALNLGPLGVRRLDSQIGLLAAAPDHDIAAELRRRRAASEGLHAGLRSRAERALGVGMGHVRVFHGPQADAIARRHGAAAFAWGPNIVLGHGVRNAPNRVMAEEVAHVAQQRGSTRGPVTLTPSTAPAERAARGAVTHILAGRRAAVGRVGRRSIMRVERDSVREEDRNPRDLAPQFGSMEARSDEELQKIVNDEEGRARYVKRGYLYAPEYAGSVTLELWLAAFDELQKRNTGPRGKDDHDKGGGEAHQAMGQSYAPDEAVQRKGAGRPGRVNVQRVARRGFRGGGQPLPYLTQLQRSFGKHDLSGVRAYVGGSAVVANMRLKARAYAMGENVAFAQTPDLHTVAHEAAHVVQQRAGVDLPGGLSQRGDRYERQADAVADAVLEGRSAEALLPSRFVLGGGLAVQREESAAPVKAGGHTNTVQIRKIKFAGGRGEFSARLKIGTKGTIEKKEDTNTEPAGGGITLGETENKLESSAKGWGHKFALKLLTAKADLDVLKALGLGEGLKVEAKVEAGNIGVGKDGPGFELAKIRVRLHGDFAKVMGYQNGSLRGEFTFDWKIRPDANAAFQAAKKATEELAEAALKRQAAQRQLDVAKAAYEARKRRLIGDYALKNKGISRNMSKGARRRLIKGLLQADPKCNQLFQQLKNAEKAARHADTAVNTAKRSLGAIKGTLGKAAGKAVGKVVATALGRQLLKLVPGLNLVMIAYDIWQIGSFIYRLFKDKTTEAGEFVRGGGLDSSDGDDVEGGEPGGQGDGTEVQDEGNPDGGVEGEGEATPQPDEGYEQAKGDLVSWVKGMYVHDGFLHVELHAEAERAHPDKVANFRSGKASFTVPRAEDGEQDKFGGKPDHEEKTEARHLFVFRRRAGSGKGAGGTGGDRADGGGGGQNQGKSYAGAGKNRRDGDSGGDERGQGAGVAVDGQEVVRGEGQQDQGAPASEGDQWRKEIGESMRARREERHKAFKESVDARAQAAADDTDKLFQHAEENLEQLESPAAQRGISVGLDDEKTPPSSHRRLGSVETPPGSTRLSVAVAAVVQHFGVSEQVAKKAVEKLDLYLDRSIPTDGLEGTRDVFISHENYNKLREELGGSNPVNRKAAGTASARSIGVTASQGVSGTGGKLPHFDRIQSSFGPSHDLSGVQAHVGGKAARAAADIGAEAYATGNAVAFASAPDLHTAAHEAAHVVQQRAGVSLTEGVGQSGDRYEQNADAVADAVVAGRAAAPLLGTARNSGVSSPAVQRREVGERDPIADLSDRAQDPHGRRGPARPPKRTLSDETYTKLGLVKGSWGLIGSDSAVASLDANKIALALATKLSAGERGRVLVVLSERNAVKHKQVKRILKALEWAQGRGADVTDINALKTFLRKQYDALLISPASTDIHGARVKAGLIPADVIEEWKGYRDRAQAGRSAAENQVFNLMSFTVFVEHLKAQHAKYRQVLPKTKHPFGKFGQAVDRTEKDVRSFLRDFTEWFGNFTKGLWQGAKDALQDQWEQVKALLDPDQLWGDLKELGSSLVASVKQKWELVKNADLTDLLKAAKQVYTEIKALISGIIDAALASVGKAAGKLKTAFGNLRKGGQLGAAIGYAAVTVAIEVFIALVGGAAVKGALNGVKAAKLLARARKLKGRRKKGSDGAPDGGDKMGADGDAKRRGDEGDDGGGPDKPKDGDGDGDDGPDKRARAAQSAADRGFKKAQDAASPDGVKRHRINQVLKGITTRPRDKPAKLEALEVDSDNRTSWKIKATATQAGKPGEKVRRSKNAGKIDGKLHLPGGFAPHAVDLVANDRANATAHTLDRHGPRIPLERIPNRKTIEGRLWGDAGWARKGNKSFRWKSLGMANRLLTQHVKSNWKAVNRQLKASARYSTTVSAGTTVGEGFINVRPLGVAGRAEMDPIAQAYTANQFRITLLVVNRGSGKDWYVETAFPERAWP